MYLPKYAFPSCTLFEQSIGFTESTAYGLAKLRLVKLRVVSYDSPEDPELAFKTAITSIAKDATDQRFLVKNFERKILMIVC